MTDLTLLKQRALEAKRSLDGETFAGMTVAGYRWKTGLDVGGSGWAWSYASHWSTPGDHDNAERLFTETDVRSLLADMEALKGERDETAATLEDREERLTATAKRWLAAEAHATALEERVRELRQAVDDRKEVMVLSSPPCTAGMIRAAHKAVDDAVDSLLAALTESKAHV